MNNSVSSAPPARAASAPALSPNVALASGVGLSLLIALIAEYVAQFIPLIGAPIIAIAIGVVLTNLTGSARAGQGGCASRMSAATRCAAASSCSASRSICTTWSRPAPPRCRSWR